MHVRLPQRRLTRWLLLVGVLAVIALGWLGFRIYQTYSQLRASEQLLTQLQGQLISVEELDPAAQTTLDDLQAATESARSAAHDPLYRAAAKLPWIGDDLMAARRLADVVDHLADDVLPRLVELRGTLSLDSVLPSGHTVDLSPLDGMGPELAGIGVQVAALVKQVETIDLTGLSDRVAQEVSSARDRLNTAQQQLEIGSGLLDKLPAILGFDGPRTYLLVFQNNAEVRSTGGMFGSFAVVTADHGTISLGDPDRSSRELPALDAPLSGYDPALISFYGDVVARDARYTNLTPDFPTAARSFATIYQQRTGTTVDGVLATDPVALGYLLNGHAPVDVGKGVWLDSGNAADFFLSGIYQKFGTDSVAREAFTAKASQVIADQILGARAPRRRRRRCAARARRAPDPDLERPSGRGADHRRHGRGWGRHERSRPDRGRDLPQRRLRREAELLPGPGGHGDCWGVCRHRHQAADGPGGPAGRVPVVRAHRLCGVVGQGAAVRTAHHGRADGADERRAGLGRSGRAAGGGHHRGGPRPIRQPQSPSICSRVRRRR